MTNNNNDKLNCYYTTIVEEGLYSSRRHLIFKTKNLFRGIELENKNVLDIGGGDGLFSLYAACNGAKKVTCIEPERDGCSKNMNNHFLIIKNRLMLSNVNLETVTLQTYENDGINYDIILLHNSINHLDENACISLLDDRQAKDIYMGIMKKLYLLCNYNGVVIISDCSDKNFFALLGVKNVFAPTIEWKKHHRPEVWVGMMSEVGFSNPQISWTSPKQLGTLGKVILGNKCISYFIASHFRLVMRKK